MVSLTSSTSSQQHGRTSKLNASFLLAFYCLLHCLLPLIFHQPHLECLTCSKSKFSNTCPAHKQNAIASSSCTVNYWQPTCSCEAQALCSLKFREIYCCLNWQFSIATSVRNWRPMVLDNSRLGQDINGNWIMICGGITTPVMTANNESRNLQPANHLNLTQGWK